MAEMYHYLGCKTEANRFTSMMAEMYPYLGCKTKENRLTFTITEIYLDLKYKAEENRFTFTMTETSRCMCIFKSSLKLSFACNLFLNYPYQRCKTEKH